MSEFAELKATQNKAASNSEKSIPNSAMEKGAAAVGEAAAAALKLSAEANSMNGQKFENHKNASTSNDTMDKFFQGAGKNVDGKIDLATKLEKPEHESVPKNAPDDVMKAIANEKNRIKDIVKNAGEAAAAGLKQLPELQLH